MKYKSGTILRQYQALYLDIIFLLETLKVIRSHYSTVERTQNLKSGIFNYNFGFAIFHLWHQPKHFATFNIIVRVSVCVCVCVAEREKLKLYEVGVGVQLLNRVWLFATPWTAADQASLVLHYLPEFPETHVHWDWICSKFLTGCSKEQVMCSKSLSCVSTMNQRFGNVFVSIFFFKLVSQRL